MFVRAELCFGGKQKKFPFFLSFSFFAGGFAAGRERGGRGGRSRQLQGLRARVVASPGLEPVGVTAGEVGQRWKEMARVCVAGGFRVVGGRGLQALTVTARKVRIGDGKGRRRGQRRSQIGRPGGGLRRRRSRGFEPWAGWATAAGKKGKAGRHSDESFCFLSLRRVPADDFSDHFSGDLPAVNHFSFQ